MVKHRHPFIGSRRNETSLIETMAVFVCIDENMNRTPVQEELFSLFIIC